MARRIRLLVLSVLSVAVLAGCFSGEPKVAEADQVGAEQAQALAAAAEGAEAPGAGGGGQEAQFIAVDIAYEDAPDVIPAGPSTFVLVNEGGIEHNVVIDALGAEAIVTALGGETATGDVTLDAGSYDFYCSIAGHRAAGMEGSLTVE